jgi:AcrR family transcriptional regulator
MLSEMDGTAESALVPSGIRQQRKQQTREALLVAARNILRRGGFVKLTARGLAREAGVAVGTVFVHFPDLTVLVETLLDEHISAALDKAFRTLPEQGDLVDELVHVSKELFDSYDIEPDLSREYLAASVFRKSTGGPLEEGFTRFQEWVIERVNAAVLLGAVPEIEPYLAFISFFSLYFSILVAGLRGQMDREQQVTLLDGALRRLFKTEERNR